MGAPIRPVPRRAILAFDNSTALSYIYKSI
jgi:hypothetical protein